MCMKLQRCNKSVFSHDLGPRQRHIVIVHRRRLRMLLAEELSHGSHSRLSELFAALLKPFVRPLRWLREARGAASRTPFLSAAGLWASTGPGKVRGHALRWRKKGLKPQKSDEIG